MDKILIFAGLMWLLSQCEADDVTVEDCSTPASCAAEQAAEPLPPLKLNSEEEAERRDL